MVRTKKRPDEWHHEEHEGLEEFRSLTLRALHVLHGEKDRNANQTMEREQVTEWQAARAVELYQKHDLRFRQEQTDALDRLAVFTAPRNIFCAFCHCRRGTDHSFRLWARRERKAPPEG